MKVLIIDDERDVRRVAALTLSRVGGHDVAEAASGLEGIEAAETHPPDVIILDVMMPGLDGAMTLAGLRERAATAHIPVVFLTAKAMPFEQDRLRSLGAAGVLLKPFDPATLNQQLDAILRKGRS